MLESSLPAITRLVGRYQGIEEYYFLDQEGELAYITGVSPHLAKETFSDDNDGGFHKRHPDFGQEIGAFKQLLVDLHEAFPFSPEMELGHVIPADDSRLWKTATLVLREHVVSVMQEAVKLAAKERTITLEEADRKINRLTLERGIHQGIDDLLSHVSTQGHHPFFPAFCYTDKADDPEHVQTASLKVVNLKYIKPEFITASDPGKFELVFSLLQSKLITRGAINRSHRVESRFKLEGE